MHRLRLGIDIGSISINTILIDDRNNVVEERYTYCHGRPFHELLNVLEDLIARFPRGSLALPVFTGSGGALAARLFGAHFVNEVVAQSTAVLALHPNARSVIEMGGEDSKLIFLSGNGELTDAARLRDFAMNSMCAAGTGSFLDQQAKRMGLSIEKEFGALALESVNPPRIAGRCSVFAKSDMIHLQQIATPVHDIVAGLCYAVARNFKSNLARGREIVPPVVFQGGVAANQGMVRAFRELLDLKDGQLVIPKYHASMGAIGAVLCSDHAQDCSLDDLTPLREHLAAGAVPGEALPVLNRPDAEFVTSVGRRLSEATVTEVALGLDVGSLSTNVVLIDRENRVIARRYLPTASRPLEAIRRGLSEIYEEVGDRVRVAAVGTTGSGRYLTGDFVGADIIQNEITAQATAAIAFDPEVDTIFEIGGQDSKFISIDDGVVVDFEMNKVCAAGTGSFLEEQAEKLDIKIVEQFGSLALSAAAPVRMGDRCTVFMESDLNSHQQKGATSENLVAGLAYSIVYNYIQKVVGTKRIGEKIFFQGGVANNRAVVAAFGQVTGKPITVPPHFDVTGAIGAAMLAWDGVGEQTRFKGFDISRVHYDLNRFTCKGCENQCEIRKVSIEGERKPLYYGGRCEKWELDERKKSKIDTPNLFEERLQILMDGFEDSAWPSEATAGNEGLPENRTTIGIPRALMVFYQQFPFWRSFFEELGFRVVLSRSTDQKLVAQSLEMLSAETCFPVEVIYGHVMDLLSRGVDYIFLPFVVNAKAESGNPTVNYNCPWVQTYPFMIRAALRMSSDPKAAARLLTPTLHFRYHENVLPNDLAQFMHERFGLDGAAVHAATGQAFEAQERFERRVAERGREVLAELPADKTPIVILGRPYNTGDPSLNLSLVEKLIGMNVLPIPVDYLPLSQESIFPDYYMMYWPNGQKILAASRLIARDDRLDAIYLGNFRCGPDSFITHYVREELTGKPYLSLEVDEHSADAGMITRCEAFLDSLRSRRGRQAALSAPSPAVGAAHRFRMPDTSGARRTLYFPYMCDGAYALAAASRGCGVDAWVLPMQDHEDIELARRYTSAKECFPAICTLGSFLKKMREPGFRPDQTAFFMPDHAGPCRFGQYNKLQRIVFDRIGFPEVEIVAPTNENAYAGLSGGHGNRFRIAALKGIFAVDLLRILLQEHRPYEAVPGETDRRYHEALDRVVESTEAGAGTIRRVLQEAGEEFAAIRLVEGPRKPIIAIVGEIFMRDNPYCSGFLVDRLERLGAETLMSPFIEWMTYSTLRYTRDSRWKRDALGFVRSKIQRAFTNAVVASLSSALDGHRDHRFHLTIEEMLDNCEPYIHRDYDGDPAVALGTANLLSGRGVSGVAHILPFTCLPGTVVGSVSGAFRNDHNGIPWVNIDFDGQEDTGTETRLEAFMYQASEYARTGSPNGGERIH